MNRTGGKLVADALKSQGVDRIFCVPGESYLEVLDGLYDHRDSIDLVVCRHEHGAANMAEADGKLTGKPGICMVTRGPGACNASIGVHTAFQDSTPMVLIVGQVPRNFLGREAFQEVDYVQMFGPLAKWVRQVEKVEDIPGDIKLAFEAATSGRPGPAVIALPEDILREKTDMENAGPYRTLKAQPDPADINELSALLAKAEKPLVLVGGGGWSDKARADLQFFAERFDLPVCCSFRRHDLMDNAHPNFVGDVGIGPDPALLWRVKVCDLLIVIGARLGEMTSQGYQLLDDETACQKLVHIHNEANELGRVFPPRLGMVSGMDELFDALNAIELPDRPDWSDWRKDARAAYEANRQRPDHLKGELDLWACMQAVDDRLGDDGIVTVDAGNFSGWPQRFLTFGGKRRLLGPTSGAMGYGVPAAIAAVARYPGRIVIGTTGDGSFGMTGQELASAKQAGLKLVIIVFNNGIYGTIRMHQEGRHPDRVIGTDLGVTNFADQAKAHGCLGLQVTTTDEFDVALNEALAYDGPALIELRINPDIITTRTTLSAITEKAKLDD